MVYKPITIMKRRWAKERFLVCSKSDVLFSHLQSRMRRPEQLTLEEYDEWVQKALALPYDPYQMSKGFYYVFDMVKKKASTNVKITFLEKVDLFLKGEVTEREMKDFLLPIVKEQKVFDAINSGFFD